MKKNNVFTKMVLMAFMIVLVTLTGCKKDEGNNATPGGSGTENVDPGDGGGNNNGGGGGGTTHAAVDLGLPSGLKWATCNIGASSPEEYGNYYAWGETETKESYTEENCSTCGLEIGDISGNSQYDAARANWGGTWRMPTNAEFEELIEECEWEWTTQNEINGYKVIGHNGNSIFLPAAGYRYETSLNSTGAAGFYWSSTPNESYTSSAYYLYFYSSNHYTNWYYRYYGYSVRPVSE